MRKRERSESIVISPPIVAWDGTVKAIRTTAEAAQVIVREFVSVKEAKALTGISDWTWREWVEMGKCASVKMGHRVLIPVSEIQRLLSDGFRPVVRIYAEREEGER